MKLSFSIPSKSKPKPSQTLDNQVNDDKSKQYVTEFDSSKTQLPTNPTRIIPPKENEWRPIKRMKNLELPISSDPTEGSEIRFEVSSLASADGGSDGISYGLNLRGGDKAEEGQERPKTEDVLLDKLKKDLERLPDEPVLEDFEEVPVEGFGAALLGGYGWYEGRGIGRNAKEDVKVKQYHKWTDKEGLGFVANEVKDGKEKAKMVKEVRKDNGSERSGDGFWVGKEVRVVGGKSGNLGSKGVIIERLDRGRVVLRVDRVEGEVKIRVSDIAELGSKEEERCLRKLRELKIEKERGMERRQNGEAESTRGDVRSEVTRGVAWLRRHIRVRVISKDLKGGRLYLKKGEVVDVVGPYKCDITMDESRELVQGVDQELLETALPRRGGPVLVLYGKHEGVFGNLVQRDLDREVGVLQESDTREMLNVKLEQIAEYIGDPSYIGY